MDDRYKRATRVSEEQERRRNKHREESKINLERKEMKRRRKRMEQTNQESYKTSPQPVPVSNRITHLRILGLKADQDIPLTIRSTYRRLALRCHPDKNPTPESCDLFRKITASYEILCA